MLENASHQKQVFLLTVSVEDTGVFLFCQFSWFDKRFIHFIAESLFEVDTSKLMNARKEECNSCFNHDFKYLINNPDICKLTSGQTEIELLIIILTVHSNTLARNALRETWLTFSRNNSANVRYAFLLGENQNTELQEILSKENEQFGDIVQENFVDAYSNLTYKTIMGYKWAASYCSVAKAVLKTDDDMYINVPNVLHIVRKDYILLQTNVFGACSQVAYPIRDASSKWFASVQSYPGNPTRDTVLVQAI